MTPVSNAKPSEGAVCAAPGTWFDPSDGKPRVFGDLLADLSKRPVILLGETHTSAEDHRWQLQVLAALFARTPNMMIGFEAFPRRLQSVLDKWVAGELSREQFLRDGEWEDVWGFPPDLYMPLFHFARMNRIPMLALNVERGLVSRVGREGWDAVPADAREGIGSPAPPSGEYRDSLARVFAQHKVAREKQAAEDKDPGENADSSASPLPDPDDPAFNNFVAAQLTWDRAMAEAISAAHREDQTRPVAAIVGRGHVDYGYGIAHQLADLGIGDPALLATWNTDRDCADLMSDAGVPIADALFAIAEEDETANPRKPRGPRLGVLLSAGEGGVRIDGVVEQSVAERAGIWKGDIVRQAAGRQVAKPGDLATTIRATPHGTWLPLVVERDGKRLELVAKFPARPHPPMAGPSPHRKKSAGE